MIQRPNKYIYGIILSTALMSSCVFAVDKVEVSSKDVDVYNAVNRATPLSEIVDVPDISIFKSTLDTIETLLKTSVVGNKDGMFSKDKYDELKKVYNEAIPMLEKFYETDDDLVKAIYNELLNAKEAFLNSENVKYKDYIAQLEFLITEAEGFSESITAGEKVGQYPSEAIEKFVVATDKAKEALATNKKDSDFYIKAIDSLKSAKTTLEDACITIKDIDVYLNQVKTLLKEISQRIKAADASSEEGRVPENKKIALSVMHKKISLLSEETENLLSMKEALYLAQCSISDFDDGSIYINNNNEVHGRKLTGKISPAEPSRETVSVVDAKEFIPKAGMAVDIKAALAYIGVSFITAGGFIFKKQK